jgi:hypothetical protein
VVLVVPAGDFAASDLPSWEAALLQSIVEIPLIAIGVAIRSPLSRMVGPSGGQAGSGSAGKASPTGKPGSAGQASSARRA